MRPILALLLTTACLAAAPAWKADLTSGKPGPHPPISPSTLDFTLSWKGMVKAGTLRIEFAPAGVVKPGSFVTKSSASSQGAAAVLFPYKHSYWSEIDPVTLGAKFFHSTEDDAKESVVNTNRYRSASISVNEQTTTLKSKKVSTETYTFPFGPAHDMFSAILYIRSQKLDVGEEHTLLLLPFKSAYLLKARVDAKEKHMGKDTIRMSFSMRKIDRTTNELKPYKKLRKPVTIWLGDDADRVPLELRAAVYIGDVRAVLTGFTKQP